MSDPTSNSAGADVTVLLGTAWARLEHQNTRWRAVLQQWASDERVASLRVVDFPSLSFRNLRRPLASASVTWDSRIAALTGRIALYRRPSPLDEFAWRATGRALSAAMPSTGRRCVVIAATPLWARVMRHVAADRRGFDAVDDWRAFPAAAHLAGHVERGYRSAASADSATAVSPALAERLRRDFGFDLRTVPNGVDLDQYVGSVPPRPVGIPGDDFAVYVGVVQQRVDAALIGAAAAVMSVVVAGPVHPTMVPALADTRATLLGEVRSDQLPALLRAASVGLIPHHVNELTTSMDPMKLREYLAAGLPVVTTIAPPVELRSDRVLVATSPRAFADAVDAARRMPPVNGPDPTVVHRTWKSVANELLDAHVDDLGPA